MSRKNDYNFLDQHKILVLQNYEIIGSWFVAKIVRVISPLCVTMGANFDAYFQRLQCLEFFFSVDDFIHTKLPVPRWKGN